MATLGERIKEIRTEHNLTQQQFAESISVSRPFISRIESNKEKPSDSLLKLICATYHIKYIWLKSEMGNKHEFIPPYKELQTQIQNSEKLDFLSGNKNKRHYSFCLSVLMNILQNNNVKDESELFYIEQIKAILVSIDYYFKNIILVDKSEQYSMLEEFEVKKQLKQEFLSNIKRYIDDAEQSLYESGLNESINE